MIFVKSELTSKARITSKAPSVFKLGASLLYESLTLIAILFVSACLFIWLFGDASAGFKRLALQLFLWGVLAGYYIRCWMKSGQTLAMQAWKLKLVDADGALLGLRLAAMRFVLATLSLMIAGLGFLWAIVDRQHLYLHDRLLKTRLILASIDVAQHPQTSQQE